MITEVLSKARATSLLPGRSPAGNTTLGMAIFLVRSREQGHGNLQYIKVSLAASLIYPHHPVQEQASSLWRRLNL